MLDILITIYFCSCVYPHISIVFNYLKCYNKLSWEAYSFCHLVTKEYINHPDELPDLYLILWLPLLRGILTSALFRVKSPCNIKCGNRRTFCVFG